MLELLEVQELANSAASDNDDPCAQEDSGKAAAPTPAPGAPAVEPKKSACKRAKIVVKDKAAGLVSKEPVASPFTGHIKKSNATNPYASKKGDDAKLEDIVRGNFSKAEMDKEVDAIKNHNLTKEDLDKSAVEEKPFKQPLPIDPGPKPTPIKPEKAGLANATQPTVLVNASAGVIM